MVCRPPTSVCCTIISQQMLTPSSMRWKRCRKRRVIRVPQRRCRTLLRSKRSASQSTRTSTSHLTSLASHTPLCRSQNLPRHLRTYHSHSSPLSPGTTTYLTRRVGGSRFDWVGMTTRGRSLGYRAGSSSPTGHLSMSQGEWKMDL